MATYTSTGFNKAPVDHPTAPLNVMSHEEPASGTASASWADLDTNILKMFKLPRGAEIIDGVLRVGDSDSSTGLALNVKVTDGTTTKTFVAASAIGQTGGSVRFSGESLGWKTTNDDFYAYVEVETAKSGTFTATATYLAIVYSTQEGYE